MLANNDVAQRIIMTPEELEAENRELQRIYDHNGFVAYGFLRLADPNVVTVELQPPVRIERQILIQNTLAPRCRRRLEFLNGEC